MHSMWQSSKYHGRFLMIGMAMWAIHAIPIAQSIPRTHAELPGKIAPQSGLVRKLHRKVRDEVHLRISYDGVGRRFTTVDIIATIQQSNGTQTPVEA